jgi:hypothetical protein
LGFAELPGHSADEFGDGFFEARISVVVNGPRAGALKVGLVSLGKSKNNLISHKDG